MHTPDRSQDKIVHGSTLDDYNIYHDRSQGKIVNISTIDDCSIFHSRKGFYPGINQGKKLIIIFGHLSYGINFWLTGARIAAESGRNSNTSSFVTSLLF